MSEEEKSPHNELSKIPSSIASSVTDDQSPEQFRSTSQAIPEEKIEKVIENIEDWENDPENARNWSFRKKWTTVGIVSFINANQPLLLKTIQGFGVYICVTTREFHDGTSPPRSGNQIRNHKSYRCCIDPIHFPAVLRYWCKYQGKIPRFFYLKIPSR